MKPCETAIAVSALAAALAEGKTLVELGIMATIFTQLGIPWRQLPPNRHAARNSRR